VPVKFKDKNGRGGIKINLKEAFGFIPKEIVVQKVQNENNKIVISAVISSIKNEKRTDRKQNSGVKGKTRRNTRKA
jgi:hypothetical protein